MWVVCGSPRWATGAQPVVRLQICPEWMTYQTRGSPITADSRAWTSMPEAVMSMACTAPRVPTRGPLPAPTGLWLLVVVACRLSPITPSLMRLRAGQRASTSLRRVTRDGAAYHGIRDRVPSTVPDSLPGATGRRLDALGGSGQASREQQRARGRGHRARAHRACPSHQMPLPHRSRSGIPMSRRREPSPGIP